MDGCRSSNKDSTDTPPTISEVLSAVDSLRSDLNKRLDEIEKTCQPLTTVSINYPTESVL